jgi:hypothetical protein
MKRLAEFFLFFLFAFSGEALGQNLRIDVKKIQTDSILSSRGEAYVGMPASLRKSYLMAVPGLTPDKTTDSLVYFYIDSEQFRQIIDQGLNYEIFTAPSMLAPVKMAGSLDEILAGTAYPTYSQYLDLMKKFRDDYPELCKIDTIGYSLNGRLILAARLQRGSYKAGNRPLVFYSSSMHGDEVVGYSLMLMLINNILQNESSSAEVSAILDKLVLVINPMSNPDGTYFQSDTSLYGAKRFNRNNVDLNRDFPDIRLGMSYSYSGMQHENVEMVKYMEKFPPTISVNFHGGAEVLNYPWDTWKPDVFSHADNDWFIEICKDYVDSARNIDPSYLQLYPEGYVFGSVWYAIEGGRQDFVTYNLRGREITIELSNTKLPAASQIQGFWSKNHAGLLSIIEKAEYGVHGEVINGLSGNPLKAKIELIGYDQHESHIFSSEETGKFFRYPSEGTYSVGITADGYRSKNILVTIDKNHRTDLTIELYPLLNVLIKTLNGSNELEIELVNDDSETFTADVYDLTGRKVQEKIFIGSTGILGGLNLHGIYVLKLKSDYQSLSRLIFL